MLLLVAFRASPVCGQVGDLQAACLGAGGNPLSCAAAVDVSDIAGVRALVLAAGGSPVAGTASTLGQRTPGSPRWGVTARVTAGRVELPDPASPGATLAATGIAWNADVAVGLIDGIPAFDTVGGVGSVDLLASLGIVNLPVDAGFRTRSPVTFGMGARIGILRESFTVPGISVSAMYRRLGTWSAGAAPQSAGGAHVRAESGSAWTVRAGIGKRISLFGVTAGIGYDRLSSDLTADVAGGGSTVTVVEDGFTSSRASLYGGLLWTRLVYGLSAEFGWQRASRDLEDGRTPASAARGGGFFLSLAGRITI